jgi:hypothetical protein
VGLVPRLAGPVGLLPNDPVKLKRITDQDLRGRAMKLH